MKATTTLLAALALASCAFAQGIPSTPKAVVEFVISPPTGYKHADLVKFVDGDQYVFVSWDNIDGEATDNLAALYDVDGDGTASWTQSLTGTISHNDRVWDAKDTDEFLYQRWQSTSYEVSRWDTSGRDWVSTAYTSGSDWESGGMAADGNRIVLSTASRTTRILDGSDDSTTTSLDIGIYSENAALSRDGLRLLTVSWGDYSMHDIENDVQEYLGTTYCDFGQVQDSEDVVALSADGDEFLVADELTKKLYIHNWNSGTSAFDRDTLTFSDYPRAVAISKDGSVGVVLTSSAKTVDGDLTAWVIDVPAGAIATDASSNDIKYVISNSFGTPHGRPQHVSVSDDGTEFGFATKENHGRALAWQAKTGSISKIPVYTAPSFWRTIDADYAIQSKGHFVFSAHANSSPQLGTVTLMRLP